MKEKKYFAPSELIINEDGSVFHLHLKPEQLADKVILVGFGGGLTWGSTIIEIQEKIMINEILGIKYPIFQGAMANISTAEFAADVSNSGALGIIGTGAMDAKMVKESIKKCKELIEKIKY